jgi:hypothetical protein
MWSGVAPVALAGLVAACGDGGSNPVLPACTTGNSFAVALDSGEYLAIDPAPNSGCVAFPANAGGQSIEYMVVPQAATGTPGITTSFRLAGDTATVAVLSAQRVGGGPALSTPDRFHEFLRKAERDRSWRGAAPAGEPRPGGEPEAPALRTGALAPPPVVGHQREFSVCATTTCARFDKVGATAVAVGQRLAIYVDTLAPSGGLNTQDLDTLIQVFDTRLYAADTAAFGRESDIDANSVVIVLMTNVVNKLVTSTQCQNEGFVAGFFFGADIDPRFANDSRFNHGEVFYSIVADPNATLSCAHSRDQVKRLVPVTFVHEFQHMISYNQHVLVRGGDSEELWLNEALSHFAEEVGGRTYLPGDQTSFSRFAIGNLFNAYSYLDTTENHFLLAAEGIGSLAERGAGWLFVRYLVDQFAADTSPAARNAFTRSLVATAQVGAVNVANRTGQVFAQTVTRWALTNWVSDLPGFTAPAELRYRSWAFRTTFASLHAQNATFFPKPFPLVPTESDGGGVDLSGTLRAGSGAYHRVIQAVGAQAFALQFGTASGGPLPGTAGPRLNVIRIR